MYLRTGGRATAVVMAVLLGIAVPCPRPAAAISGYGQDRLDQALLMASELGYGEAVELLLKHGADPEARERRHGKTAVSSTSSRA